MNCSSDVWFCSGTMCGASVPEPVPYLSGQAAVDLAISQGLSLVFSATGRIQSAERAKPSLQELHGYNLTNLLSACGADSGHERKGDFHVKATPAESKSRTTQETSQVPVEASAGRELRGFDSHSREPSALEKPVGRTGRRVAVRACGCAAGDCERIWIRVLVQAAVSCQDA